MRVILSLTTTFQRQDILSYTMRSLMEQTYKPDIILLNISNAPYLNDKGFSNEPEFLKHLTCNIIKVNWVDNTGPYRKILPAIDDANKDDIIITVDDDIIYNKYFLEKLLTYYNNNHSTIIAGLCRLIKKNIFGNWKNYSSWDMIRSESTELMALPLGAGGVLYKKSFFDLDFLCDKKFKEIAPCNDDLWIRMASLRMKTPVAVFPDISQKNYFITHPYGLAKNNLMLKMKTNCIQEQITRLKNYLGINITPNDFAWDKICKYTNFKY